MKNLQMQETRYFTHPVKVTALLYLKIALLAQAYEECAELIQLALEFGASNSEVRNLLENPRREVT